VITRRTYIRRSWLKRKPRRYVVPDDILAYWDWIRAQPCAVCGGRRGIEAAHVGLRGLGQKCDGWEVLPLCKTHHARGLPASHHTLGKKFWSFHNLDRYPAIRKYWRLYDLAYPGSAARVEDGAGDIRRGGVTPSDPIGDLMKRYCQALYICSTCGTTTLGKDVGLIHGNYIHDYSAFALSTTFCPVATFSS
jgi:hypothetical protein